MGKISFRRRLRMPKTSYYRRNFRNLESPHSSDEEGQSRPRGSKRQDRGDEASRKVTDQVIKAGKLLENDGGTYTSEEDEDELDTTATALKSLALTKQLLLEKSKQQMEMPSDLKKDWTVLACDGGVYTTDEEEEDVPPNTPNSSPRAPPKKPEKNIYLDNRAKRFHQILAYASTIKEEARRFGVYDCLPMSSYLCEDVHLHFDVLKTAPALSFYCAEYFYRVFETESPFYRRCLKRAVIRCIIHRFDVDSYYWVPEEQRRRRKLIYSTFFAYLHLVDLVPTKIVKRCVNRLFQTNNFEDTRIHYFDPDSVLYVTRILKIIAVPFDSSSAGKKKMLEKWWKHLARIDHGPMGVRVDVRYLLALRNGGQWSVDSTDRHDFEYREAGDTAAFITNNSYGRKLYVSSEIMSLYSPFFLMLFSSRKQEATKIVELRIDVEYYLMREILYILYHVHRIFTDEHFDYDMDVLLDIYGVAEQYDFPLIRRMVSEQLNEEPAREIVKVAYDRGFVDIVSTAMARMTKSEIDAFLVTCDLEGSLKMRDLTSVLRKLCPGAFVDRHCPIHPEPEDVTMFPSDFATEWPLFDIALQCNDNSSKFLYANSAVLAEFSDTFKHFKEEMPKMEGGPHVVNVDVKFNTMKAILRIVHHVNRRFGRLECPNVSPFMLGPVLKAGYYLEMPVVVRMMEDVLSEYLHEQLIQTAITDGIPATDLTRSEDGAIVTMICRQARGGPSLLKGLETIIARRQ